MKDNNFHDDFYKEFVEGRKSPEDGWLMFKCVLISLLIIHLIGK